MDAEIILKINAEIIEILKRLNAIEYSILKLKDEIKKAKT